MTRVARIGASELFRGHDGAQFGDEMDFITRQGRHRDFRKGQVLVLFCFKSSNGHLVADEYSDLDVHWQGTLTMFVDLHISTGGNARTQLEVLLRKQYLAEELDAAEGLLYCSPNAESVIHLES